MPLGPQAVSQASFEESLGSLRSCLVEGDAEQRNRERRVRRRSLVISILIQTAVVALLTLLPLFGKTERIALAKDAFIPIPPYGHPSRPHDGRRATKSGTTNSGPRFDFDVSKPLAPPVRGESNSVDSSNLDPLGSSLGEGPACTGCVDIGEKNSAPRPPQSPAATPVRPPILHFTQLDPAMLLHRVEPVYPPLAIQIHREGRVELRAIIATDGTIRSLEIVSGDPIFYQSAKDAVSQWLYRPTVLNGQKMEIDTYITVIYTMQH